MIMAPRALEKDYKIIQKKTIKKFEEIDWEIRSY
jgi:hypothetical protein